MHSHCVPVRQRHILRAAASSPHLRRCASTHERRLAERTNPFLPAMIAAVNLDEGPIAIHRTFLSGEPRLISTSWARAWALGEAAVRLFAPVSGKLGLAEGVESAMSAYALTGIPVWATLGNERFGLVSVPESVTELHLFVDHDAGGELAASRGLAAYAREGRTIHVRKPSSRDTDWNDELTAWLRRKAAR